MVCELGKYYDVDVALIIRQNGQYITYRSTDPESFLLSMKEIVRVCLFYLFSMLRPWSRTSLRVLYGRLRMETSSTRDP
jgi:hypothetical protein